MTLGQDLTSEVRDIYKTAWTERDGTVVPETSDLKLGNDAVKLEAAVLYADLVDSTGLVTGYKAHFAAEVYKAYLHCAAKIIRANSGVICAYDGDRVMGVFIGDTKRSNAAKTGLQINWAVREIVNKELVAQYSSTKYRVAQAVGIDMSSVYVARTGVRGANDLVWVGRSANYAAKLCAVRDATNSASTFITEQVYSGLAEWAKNGGEPKRDMWQRFHWAAMGVYAYRSTWTWAVK